MEKMTLLSPNRFWEAPSVFQLGALPPRAWFMPCGSEEAAAAPDAVFGETSDRCTSLNGRWKFRFFRRWFDAPEEFYRRDDSFSDWAEISVPRSWQTDREACFEDPHYIGNSYPYQNEPPFVGATPVGIYRREFDYDCPRGDTCILRFEGGGSCMEIWLNEKRIGVAKGSHLPSEFDVTDALVSGKNLLAVRVFKYSSGSYPECQDHFFLSGIFRNVSLIRRGHAYLQDAFIHPNQSYNSFERLPPPMPISISNIVCSGSFLFLEKSFPGTFTHASKFAAVFFIAWNNADRTRSGYEFLFTWKASLKNVIIFKAKPSIFIDLSSVFVKNIIFICPPALKQKRSTTIISDRAF